MYIDFITDKFAEYSAKDAFILQGRSSTYKDLADKYDFAKKFVAENNIQPGSVIGLEADYSPLSTALLFALIDKAVIVVPFSSAVKSKEEFIDIANVSKLITVNDDDTLTVKDYHGFSDNPLYAKLRAANHPGLVLFSSGSTGVSKAAVHDFTFILEKYKEPRKLKRMITFLLFDHIGGINTLLHNISNGGCVIAIRDRSPKTILETVQKYKVEILPVSPTFLNMILLSEAYKDYDLSSLDTISYGTEVMPESTLTRLHSLFPNIRLLQTYGLSEIGIMKSKSKSSDSLWVKIGGDGFETRIVDNMLEIKAASAMLGYLNAPSPFTEDGWFKTMDVVEVDGEYLKILGRKSELINVGGEKVYPAEIESVLMKMDGVIDAAVKAEANPIVGNIVVAKVGLTTGETAAEFKKRMRVFCRDKMSAYKIPQKIVLATAEELRNNRYKKVRK